MRSATGVVPATITAAGYSAVRAAAGVLWRYTKPGSTTDSASAAAAATTTATAGGYSAVRAAAGVLWWYTKPGSTTFVSAPATARSVVGLPEIVEACSWRVPPPVGRSPRLGGGHVKDARGQSVGAGVGAGPGAEIVPEGVQG